MPEPLDEGFHLCGQLEVWPRKSRMAGLLRGAGLSVVVGRYSITFCDCEHFRIQEYGGDWGPPYIDADADTLDRLHADARRVSDALAASDLRHRFELYDGADRLVGYLHHRWPVDDTSSDS